VGLRGLTSTHTHGKAQMERESNGDLAQNIMHAYAQGTGSEDLASRKGLDKGNNLPAHPDLLCSQVAHRESSLCYQNPDMLALQKIGNMKGLFVRGSAQMSCQIPVPSAFSSKSCTTHSRRTHALHSSWATSKPKATSDCPGSGADDLAGIAQRSS